MGAGANQKMWYVVLFVRVDYCIFSIIRIMYIIKNVVSMIEREKPLNTFIFCLKLPK